MSVQKDVSPVRTAQNTLALAASSYLAPWFECMLLAMTLGAALIDPIPFESRIDQLGVGAEMAFDQWWFMFGFEALGAGITSVQMTPPSKANGGMANFATPMNMPSEQSRAEMLFLHEQLQTYVPGKLSSNPLLWSSFRTNVKAPRLTMYLNVLRCVLLEPSDVGDRVFRVGQQLNIVPKCVLRSTDSDAERKEKRDKITHDTFRYYECGKALMLNAVLGDFPNIKMPKALVKKRRSPRRKPVITKYDRWDTGARIVSA